MTRPHTDSTEATSYYRLAKAGNLFSHHRQTDRDVKKKGVKQESEDGAPNEDFDRVTTEEYALDSYENVLFSIARFRE
jgi:hypothetical protein